MDVATVTLDEVLRASQSRAASLVPETAGYLALAVGDGAARLPFRVEDRAVKLTTEGSVLVERGKDVIPPEEAGRVLRDILARLLDSSVGSMPGLASAARPRQEDARGMEAVIEELESALIPVNRAAARRALARLARETVRAKQSGRLRRRTKAPRSRKAHRPAPAPESAKPVEHAVAEPEIPVTLETMAPESAPVEPTPVESAPVESAPAISVSAPEPSDALPEPTPTVFEDGLVTFERSEEDFAMERAALAADESEDAAIFDTDLADPTILQVTTVVEPEPHPEVEPHPQPELHAKPEVQTEPEPALQPVVPPAPRLPSDELEVQAESAEPQPRRASRRPGSTAERESSPKDADIVSGPKSDVDDLLRRFGESKLGSGDVREIAAELKSMVGLDATPPPPQTAPHTIVMERPSEMEPPIIDAAPLVFSPSRSGRVARAGMALKVAILTAGIAATALIWRYHPAIFAGHESPIVQDPPSSAP